MDRTNDRRDVPDGVVAWVYLLRIFMMIQARAGRDLRAAGITPAQFDVLTQLGPGADGTTQRALGERLICTKANVSVLIENMSRRGLVARREHVDDRRCNLVRLTERGRRLRGAILPSHEKRINRWIGQSLSAAEQHRLRSLLYKVVRTLYREDRDPGRTP